MTVPPLSRLSGPKNFSRVFKQAVVSSDPCFKVLGRNTGQRNARLGMAVSRKVDRRAVQRNRLKRIIRESFRAHYMSNRGGRAVDIVVLPRPTAVTISNGRLFEQLSLHWQRIDQQVDASRRKSVSTPLQTGKQKPSSREQ